MIYINRNICINKQQILKVLKTDVLDKISNIEGLISNKTTQKKSK